MDTAAKSKPSSVHRAISWLFFVVFGALLGFGIVVYAQSSTQISGLAMAVIGILGIAALATSLRLARGRALGNRRPIYAGGRAGAWNAGGGGIHQHDQWFHNQRIWEQRQRDDEYYQQQHQQQLFHQQQQMWNN